MATDGKRRSRERLSPGQDRTGSANSSGEGFCGPCKLGRDPLGIYRETSDAKGATEHHALKRSQFSPAFSVGNNNYEENYSEKLGWKACLVTKGITMFFLLADEEWRDDFLHSGGRLLVAKLRMLFKELGETVSFVSCVDFWIMAVLWNYSLIISYMRLFINWLLQAKRVPRKALVEDASKPVCIVTGATSGLGAAASRALSKEGFTVVLVGRSSHLLSKMVAEIQNDNTNARLKAFQVDVSSFQSILKFKNSLHEWLSESEMHLSIQLLINNAGILATSSRLSAEGHDQMMATNYTGAVLLTKLLLPLLKNSPVPSRIVNVSSFTHLNACTTQCDKDTVTGKKFLGMKHYPYAQIYEYSKLCILLFTYELHRQLQLEKCTSVSVNAADPGAVNTKIMRELPNFLSYAALSILNMLGMLSSPERGVNSILDAALAPPDTSGLYFFGGNGRTIASSSISHDKELASQLWATSSELLFVSAQFASEPSSNLKQE